MQPGAAPFACAAAALEARETLLDAVLQALVVAGLEMQAV